ncbi:MAG TPA: zinc ribbon domain-containing protein [Verrucomicrobiae bacterium]|nr:zinc ribbon domain-containing protein [Verrucomicrobiae bacterium]
MKKCGYCGRENEDGARFCVECGTEFFETPAVSPKPKPPRRWPDLRLRYAGYALAVVAFYFLSFGPVMYCFSKVTVTTTATSGAGPAYTKSVSVQLPAWVVIPYYPAFALYARQGPSGIYGAYVQWWIERHEAKR